MKKLTSLGLIMMLYGFCYSEENAFSGIADSQFENTYILSYYQSEYVKLSCYKVKINSKYSQIDGLFSINGVIELRNKIIDNKKIENDPGNSIIFEKNRKNVIVDNLMLSATLSYDFTLCRVVIVYTDEYIFWIKMDYPGNYEKIEEDLYKLKYLVRTEDVDSNMTYQWDYQNKKDVLCLEKTRNQTIENTEMKEWYLKTESILEKIKKANFGS